jgi:hypothetical protein
MKLLKQSTAATPVPSLDLDPVMVGLNRLMDCSPGRSMGLLGMRSRLVRSMALAMSLLGMASLIVRNMGLVAMRNLASMDPGMGGDPSTKMDLAMRSRASMGLVMDVNKNRITGLAMRDLRVRNMDLGIAGDPNLNMVLDMRSQVSTVRVMGGIPNLNTGLGTRSPANMKRGLRRGTDPDMGGGQGPNMKKMGRSMCLGMAGSRVTRKREKGMEEGANMRSQVVEMIHLRGLAMKEPT